MVCDTLTWISSAKKLRSDWKLLAVSTRRCCKQLTKRQNTVQTRVSVDQVKVSRTLAYLHSVLVSVHLLLQALQSFQQPVD